MKSDRQLLVPLDAVPDWPDRCCSCLVPSPSAWLVLEGFASWRSRHPAVRFEVPICSGCRRHRRLRWTLRGVLLLASASVVTFLNADWLGRVLFRSGFGVLQEWLLLGVAILVVQLWWRWRPILPIVQVKGMVAQFTFGSPEFCRAVLEANPDLLDGGAC